MHKAGKASAFSFVQSSLKSEVIEMKVFCPKCESIHESGKCPAMPTRVINLKRRKDTRTRSREREPWRKAYTTAGYQRARQLAIARTGGRCTDCGRVCAYYDGKRWRTQGMGGEVDHVQALCEGVDNRADNLELRCASCHRRRDEARRQAHHQPKH